MTETKLARNLQAARPAARNGFQVVLLGRNKEAVRSIQVQHRNPSYLTDYPLPFNLGATLDPAKALNGCSMIVHSIPVQASRDALRDLKVSRGRCEGHPPLPSASTLALRRISFHQTCPSCPPPRVYTPRRCR